MMGSSSVSSSTTGYVNTPVTQENVSNPLNLNLANSNAYTNLGSQLTVGGSLTLNQNADAKAVGQAFDFGSKLVQVVADITRQNNASQAAAANDETKAAATGDTKNATAFDWTKYKTELMIGAGILAWWFLGRKK